MRLRFFTFLICCLIMSLKQALSFIILGFLKFLHGYGPIPDMAPIEKKNTRQLRAECSGSGGFGSGSSSASSAWRFWAAKRMLSDHEGSDWLRGQ